MTQQNSDELVDSSLEFKWAQTTFASLTAVVND